MPARQARRSAGVFPRYAARLLEKNRVQPVVDRSCVPDRQRVDEHCLDPRPPQPAPPSHTSCEADQLAEDRPDHAAGNAPTTPKARPELIWNSRQSAVALSPAMRRSTNETLKLPVENTASCCGHVPTLRTFLLIFVSHFWGALHTSRSDLDRQPDASPAMPSIVVSSALHETTTRAAVAIIRFQRTRIAIGFFATRPILGGLRSMIGVLAYLRSHDFKQPAARRQHVPFPERCASLAAASRSAMNRTWPPYHQL